MINEQTIFFYTIAHTPAPLLATMSLQNLRLPDPLKVFGGNVADNWERFKDQWENYERAADLTDASAEKRAAVFLTCLGGEAYDTYRSLASPPRTKGISPNSLRRSRLSALGP